MVSVPFPWIHQQVLGGAIDNMCISQYQLMLVKKTWKKMLPLDQLSSSCHRYAYMQAQIGQNSADMLSSEQRYRLQANQMYNLR